MQLSKFTDYTFRTLIYLANNKDKNCVIDDLVKELDVSKDNLKKVVNRLSKTEYINTTKGRSGGIKLAIEPEKINLGDVIQSTEENFNIVQCMGTNVTCPLINRGCKLKCVLLESVDSFVDNMRKYTLADIL